MKTKLTEESYQKLADVRREILTSVENELNPMPELAQWFDSVKITAEVYKKVVKLNKYWKLPTARMIRFSNAIDLPFIKLCLWLSEQRAVYNTEMFISEWRTLKAIGYNNIIGYVRHADWLESIYEKKTITLKAIVQRATNVKDILEAFEQPKKIAEFRLRELLGISMEKDIKPAWIEWCKRNHPDKGGSNETFALYNAAWEMYNDDSMLS